MGEHVLLLRPPAGMHRRPELKRWAMSMERKFPLVMALVTPVLLLPHRFGVHDTALVSLPNGPWAVAQYRTRPAR